MDFSKVIPTRLTIGSSSYNFRSKSEAIFALYLQDQISVGFVESWQYEPTRFAFAVNARNVVHSYLPDFRVVFKSGVIVWYEVKGRMTQADIQRHRLFISGGNVLYVIKTDSPFMRKIYNKYNRFIK